MCSPRTVRRLLLALGAFFFIVLAAALPAAAGCNCKGVNHTTNDDCFDYCRPTSTFDRIRGNTWHNDRYEARKEERETNRAIRNRGNTPATRSRGGSAYSWRYRQLQNRRARQAGEVKDLNSGSVSGNLGGVMCSGDKVIYPKPATIDAMVHCKKQAAKR